MEDPTPLPAALFVIIDESGAKEANVVVLEIFVVAAFEVAIIQTVKSIESAAEAVEVIVMIAIDEVVVVVAVVVVVCHGGGYRNSHHHRQR
jgi:succinate dehydrogenase/fumarate reductase cytochrome b subunit